jgi:hypothetical protein
MPELNSSITPIIRDRKAFVRSRFHILELERTSAYLVSLGRVLCHAGQSQKPSEILAAIRILREMPKALEGLGEGR